MHSFTTDHTFEYDTDALTNGTGERIGTIFYFEDEPLKVGRDESGSYPNMVFIEYDDRWIGQELDHPVTKCTADDAKPRLTTAVAFSPQATTGDIARMWSELH